MSKSSTKSLRELERIARRFGDGSSARKQELMLELEGARLGSAEDVSNLHEALCFLRALPDDAGVLRIAERMLASFPDRADLRRHRAALANTGIGGTDVHFTFYQSIASWLARKWGDDLRIEWDQVENPELLADRVYLLALDAETPALDHAKLSARRWVERFKGPDETDAAFVVRRFDGLKWDATVRDLLYDELSLPLVFRTGAHTPSRSSARLSGGKTVFQEGPWRGPRPDLRVVAKQPPLSIRSVNTKRGQEAVELAFAAMMTRERHLDAFAGGDARDVRIVDCGGGLELALIGSKPEWRMMLEGVYGWMILQNRVPIGYVLVSAFLRSSEIAFNVFDTWRGGDAAHIYGRVVATARALFGSDTFTIYPYQLGHKNPEGLKSGAWWFYYKLGFRPRDPDAVELMESELRKMRRDPSHRSTIATLKKLSQANVYLELGRRRKAVIGTFAFERVGFAVADYLSERFGSRRERAERECASDAAKLLGVRDWKRFPTNERKAWLRWSPLVLVLPGVDAWSPADKRALVRIVRAKGGRRESDFIRLFDAHPQLTKALVELSEARGE